MSTREERGQAIAATQTLVLKNGVWQVPSQSGNGVAGLNPSFGKSNELAEDGPRILRFPA